jgi:hypothetical protein
MSLKIKEWEEYKAAHRKPVVDNEVEPTYFVRIKLGWFTIPFNVIILLGFWKLGELIWWLV